MSDKRKARTVAETPTHSPVGGPGSGSRPASEQDAPVIVSNVPGSFARGVLANRHPALIEQVRDAFPYGPRQHEALDALLDANNNGVIEPLAPSESDQELWWGLGARALRAIVVRRPVPVGGELLLP